MDYIVNGISVHGAETEEEARKFAAEAGPCTVEIDIDRSTGTVKEKYYRRVPFDRIRRITGYLVGTLDRFNDAKKAEEADRVKHTI